MSHYIIKYQNMLIRRPVGVMMRKKDNKLLNHTPILREKSTNFKFFSIFIKNIDAIRRHAGPTIDAPVPPQIRKVPAQTPKILANDPYDADAPIRA